MNAPVLRREAPCDCEDCRDTTCPECGTDHSDNMQRTLERKLEALRAENAALREQRDELMNGLLGLIARLDGRAS